MPAAVRRPTLPAVRWGTVVLALGLAVQLLPLVLFPTVVTQDGSAHVGSAWVLLHHGDSGVVGAVLREHYRVDLSPVPNMLSTLVLAALVPVVGADGAERLVVIGLVVGLVAALGYALRGVDRRAGLLAVAALPLCGSHLVVLGFYNFIWGVVGALLVTGLAVRRRSGWSPGSAVALCGLLLLTWLSHLLPFLVATAVVALLAALRAVEATRHGMPRWPVARRHLVPVVLAAVPAAFLTAVYLLSGPAPSGRPVGTPSLARLGLLASGAKPFVALSRAELPAATATVAAIVVLLLAGRRTAIAAWPERWALAVALVVGTLACSLTPSRLGTEFGFLDDRLAWFPPLFAVLWAATRLPGRRVTGVAVVTLALAASAGVVVRLPQQAAAAQDVSELMSVSDAIAPGSTLVVLQFTRTRAWPEPVSPDLLRHPSSRLAVRASSVDVGLYEAVQPYFQVAFRAEPGVRRRLDPGDGLEHIPPLVDLPAVRGRLDYVIVLGLDRAAPAVRTSSATRKILAELEGHYTRVARSRPTGLVTVWRMSRTPGDGFSARVPG